MKKSIVSLFGLLFVIIFGACNFSSKTSEVPVTIQPTETVFISPTSTAPFVPTVDPLTPSAIAQFFQTLEAKTSTPEPTSTANYKDCSGNMFFMSRGSWGLCHGLRDPITIISQSNQKWQFSYKEYYGRQVPNPCTRLLHLTDDEKFLYFSLDAECELIEPGFISSIGVFRMNLSDGEVSEILKASYDFDSYTGTYYTASISPTGRRLTYITDQDRPLKLNLLDLKTGENHSFSIEGKYTYGGAYTWSEDGTKLVFMLESKTDNDHFISMVYVDILKDNSMVTFINDKEYRWVISQIEITDAGVKISMVDEEPLFYDPTTGILSPINK
jgi:hypothetical protein